MDLLMLLTLPRYLKFTAGPQPQQRFFFALRFRRTSPFSICIDSLFYLLRKIYMCTYIFLFLSFSSLAVAAHVSVPLTIIWRIGCRSCPWIRSVFGCRSLSSQVSPGQPQTRPAPGSPGQPQASQPASPAASWQNKMIAF